MRKKIISISVFFGIFVLIIGLLYVHRTEIAGIGVVTYNYQEIPLVHNNIKLHLDRIEVADKQTNKNILLIHGVTYSSQEFDIDYKDYSLVRALARAGFSVWRLDIAGYGRSEALKNGFLSNSEYAAENINAAVEKIIQITGQNKIDLLGWSWGTVTTSKFASKHPEHLNKLILFAPILSGIGKCDAKNPFHHNTWEHAADDFQKDVNGDIDYSITEPIVVELWCSKCWHYDKDTSPNGGRRDICVDNSKKLIDLSKLKTPTLIIYGDNDTYLNYKLLGSIQTILPKGSAVKIISGGSHVVFVEKPYYKDFQKTLIQFLKK